MKRTLPIIAFLLLAGCDQAPPPPPPPAVAAIAPVSLAAKTDAIDWKDSWPSQAAAVPSLDVWLRKDADDSKAEATEAAAEDKSAAKTTGNSFNPHSYAQKWIVEGSPPGLISLSGAFEEYTGGAHGMSGWKFVIWDVAADEPVEFNDLFTDKGDMQDLIAAGFCPALDAERGKRRGAPVRLDKADPFTRCPTIGDQVLVPAGPAGKPFTKVRVLIPPYEAGPFAEGGYEISVPVTADLAKLVQPQYRAAFVAGAR